MARSDNGGQPRISARSKRADILRVYPWTKGLISIVAALITMVPVVVALLARIVVHERLQQIQIAGAGLAVAGVACISAG